MMKLLLILKVIHKTIRFDSGAEPGARQEAEQGNSKKDMQAIATEKKTCQAWRKEEGRGVFINKH